MSIEFFKLLGWFVVLCLVQVLILNHIHLFDIAIPLLYVYFTITFRRGIPKWIILLWSFALGLAGVDEPFTKSGKSDNFQPSV